MVNAYRQSQETTPPTRARSSHECECHHLHKLTGRFSEIFNVFRRVQTCSNVSSKRPIRRPHRLSNTLPIQLQYSLLLLFLFVCLFVLFFCSRRFRLLSPVRAGPSRVGHRSERSSVRKQTAGGLLNKADDRRLDDDLQQQMVRNALDKLITSRRPLM